MIVRRITEGNANEYAVWGCINLSLSVLSFHSSPVFIATNKYIFLISQHVHGYDVLETEALWISDDVTQVIHKLHLLRQ